MKVRKQDTRGWKIEPMNVLLDHVRLQIIAGVQAEVAARNTVDKVEDLTHSVLNQRLTITAVLSIFWKGPVPPTILIEGRGNIPVKKYFTRLLADRARSIIARLKSGKKIRYSPYVDSIKDFVKGSVREDPRKEPETLPSEKEVPGSTFVMGNGSTATPEKLLAGFGKPKRIIFEYW